MLPKPSLQIPNSVLTPREAAALKRVSRTAIYSAIAEGRLPSIRILGRLAIQKSDLEAWRPVRYAGRSKGFSVGDETKARMAAARRQWWEKRRK